MCSGSRLQQELKARTRINLERRALVHHNHTGYQCKATAHQELTTPVYGKAAIEQVFVIFVKRLVGAVEVVERTTQIQAVVLVKNHEPQQTCCHVGKQKFVAIEGRFTWIERTVKPTAAIVLQAPAQAQEVETTLSNTGFGTYYEVVATVAATAHFFGIRARQLTREGREVCFASPVAPKGTANAEVIVATYRNALIVRHGIGAERIFTQYAGPLVAVVGRQTYVTIHHPRHRRVEVERRQIKL